MKYWKVYQNIFFTRGYNRTLVFDSLKGSIKFIPNELYDKLLSKKFLLIKEDIDYEYFEYLLSNNYIFTDKKKNLKKFIKIKKNFSIAYDIGVCVIELSEITGNNLFKLIETNIKKNIINQFNFIFTKFTTLDSILNFVNFIKDYEVDLIELTITNEFKEQEFLFSKLNDINKMIVVNNFQEKEVIINDSQFKNRTQSHLDIKSLKINPNLYSFFESKKYNIYYYNKIFINRKSEIKNSEGTNYIYGKLSEMKFLDFNTLLNDSELKKYWYSNKEKTYICQICEFRNLCSDNRIPIKISKEYWYHQKECEYNPYISKWENEAGYQNLNDSGVYFDGKKLIVDEQIIANINKNLWG